MGETTQRWPALPLEDWQDTYTTVHMWTQIVGKIRLAQSPWVNHSWHVTLYVTSRGLTTGPIPHGDRTFQIDFDFIDHELVIEGCDGGVRTMSLEPKSVADFYGELMGLLGELGFDVKIYATPNEVPDAIAFAEDREHKSYDAEAVGRYWSVLYQADRLLHRFRAGFLGKCSPVHFFWGAFDLAVTRFNGEIAPPHPGGLPGLPDWITREAYSHAVISCGFWPGGGPLPYPLFYAYAYPEPDGFRDAAVTPSGAFYDTTMGEFVLPWDEVRKSDAPDDAVLGFLQSTYEAAANLAGWDRAALERAIEPVRAG